MPAQRCVEIDPVDQTPNQKPSFRPIIVDMIQHDAGIKTMRVADLDPLRQAPYCPHQNAREVEFDCLKVQSARGFVNSVNSICITRPSNEGAAILNTVHNRNIAPH